MNQSDSNAGISRSATVVAAYLIKYHMHTVQSAIELIRKARPAAKPNAGFMSQLLQYSAAATS
jgi:dual specificity phosphatase 12